MLLGLAVQNAMRSYASGGEKFTLFQQMNICINFPASRVHVEREYLLLLLLFLFGNACFSNGSMVSGYAYGHC